MVPNLGPLNTELSLFRAQVSPRFRAQVPTGQPTGNAAGAMVKGGADVAQTNAGVAPDPATLAGNAGKTIGGIPGFSGVAVPVAGSATLGGVATTVQPGGGAVTTDPATVFPGGSATFDETGGGFPGGNPAGCSIICSAPFTTAGTGQEAHSQRPLEQPQRRLRRQKGYWAYHQRH